MDVDRADNEPWSVQTVGLAWRRLGVVTPSEAALQDRLSREFERFPIKGPGYCSCATSAARAFPFTAVPSHQTCPPGISVGAINVWWLTLNAHSSIRPALRRP